MRHSVSVLYCRVDHGADLKEVVKDIRDLAPAILLMTCEMSEHATVISKFLKRRPDEVGRSSTCLLYTSPSPRD